MKKTGKDRSFKLKTRKAEQRMTGRYQRVA